MDLFVGVKWNSNTRFICPSRKESAKNAQSEIEQEYGSTIRIFSPRLQCWEIFYGSTTEATRLQARKVNGEIVLTQIPDENMKWIFSDITKDSFNWRNIHLGDDNKWPLHHLCTAI